VDDRDPALRDLPPARRGGRDLVVDLEDAEDVALLVPLDDVELTALGEPRREQVIRVTPTTFSSSERGYAQTSTCPGSCMSSRCSVSVTRVSESASSARHARYGTASVTLSSACRGVSQWLTLVRKRSGIRRSWACGRVQPDWKSSIVGGE
jgi:hypothetical protein